jgi:hypothetical protein
VMIVMCPLLLMGRILIICGTRLLNISIITMVLQLQLLTTVCVYTEDTDPVLQTVRLHTFLFATGVMGVLFGWLAYVGSTDWVILTLIIPSWILCWILSIPLLNSRSEYVREDRIVHGYTIGTELCTGVLAGVVLTGVIYTIVGTISFIQYISDPTTKAILISFVYPLFKYGLRIGMVTLQTRTGLDNATEDIIGRIQQRMRLSILIEIMFGMPGQCALVILTSWPAFLFSVFTSSVTQWLSEHAILWKQRIGISSNISCRRVR